MKVEIAAGKRVREVRVRSKRKQVSMACKSKVTE